MEVRVGESADLSTGRTVTTGRTRPLIAQESLCDPKGQPLLPHTGRTNKKGRLREPAGGNGTFQPVQQGIVSVDRPQAHSSKNLPISGLRL